MTQPWKSHSFTVLVSLGHYNESPWVECLQQQTLLTVRKEEIRVPAWSGACDSPLPVSCVFSHGTEKTLASDPILIRTLVPSWGPHPHHLVSISLLLKVPPSSTIALGTRDSRNEFGGKGHKHSVCNIHFCPLLFLRGKSLRPVHMLVEIRQSIGTKDFGLWQCNVDWNSTATTQHLTLENILSLNGDANNCSRSLFLYTILLQNLMVKATYYFPRVCGLTG